ncbi:MAG: tRNA pseudouridine(38-40) synthase TruA [Clostridiales bacterium]|jgi:tRNA pseudouridine38-40 synthase|nr:tRNA pseudouridine(38-40) synthase TruA [Clostridiales bacterium]
MRNLLLTLCFDGTAYHGWQVQKNAVTVQQTFQDAVERVIGSRENVTGCSRTDSGVHANMFCCNIKTESSIPSESFVAALNANLPLNIAVTGCREVPASFHARYSCISKEYIYKILNTKIRNPFCENRCLHYPYPLNEKQLDVAAKGFLGTHDFCGFSSAGSAVEDTVRTVIGSEVFRINDEVIFRVEANGFLYNMVRIMAGTLISVAQGKIEATEIPDIVKSCDRNRAGITAPAHGLYLNKVNYYL